MIASVPHPVADQCTSQSSSSLEQHAIKLCSKYGMAPYLIKVVAIVPLFAAVLGGQGRFYRFYVWTANCFPSVTSLSCCANHTRPSASRMFRFCSLTPHHHQASGGCLGRNPFEAQVLGPEPSLEQTNESDRGSSRFLWRMQ